MTFARTVPFVSLFSSSHAAAHADRRAPRASVRQVVASYVADRAQRTEVRATIQALAELDDAGLADIGLHRSQIASVARETAAKSKAR